MMAASKSSTGGSSSNIPPKPLGGPLSETRSKPTQNNPVRQQYRIIDEATRNRRTRQLLDQLERDNFHEDPHANLVMHKKAPKFDESPIKNNNFNATTGGHNANSSRRHVHKTRMLSLAAMIDEDQRLNPDGPNYSSAAAPAPDRVTDASSGKVLIKIPARHFCSVCGFKAPYTCITCGNRYCSVPCLGTHRDTRCLKWTA